MNSGICSFYISSIHALRDNVNMTVLASSCCLELQSNMNGQAEKNSQQMPISALAGDVRFTIQALLWILALRAIPKDVTLRHPTSSHTL